MWVGIFKKMGGNIPGKNLLGWNFPGGNSPSGSLIGGNFPGENIFRFNLIRLNRKTDYVL